MKCLSLPPPDIRHPEELSLLRKPRDPKKKKKKLEEAEEDDLELEGPLLTPGSGELMDSNSTWRENREIRMDLLFSLNKKETSLSLLVTFLIELKKNWLMQT